MEVGREPSMQVIARIPEVRPPVSAPARHPAPAGPTAVEPGPQPSALRHWAVGALAAVALLAWGLASWNDARRAAGPRQPARIAAQPPSVAAPTRPVGP